jgi:hypothetical protein
MAVASLNAAVVSGAVEQAIPCGYSHQVQIPTIKSYRLRRFKWTDKKFKVTAQHFRQKRKTPWPLVCERTIPTERLPRVDEI